MASILSIYVNILILLHCSHISIGGRHTFLVDIARALMDIILGYELSDVFPLTPRMSSYERK